MLRDPVRIVLAQRLELDTRLLRELTGFDVVWQIWVVVVGTNGLQLTCPRRLGIEFVLMVTREPISARGPAIFRPELVVGAARTRATPLASLSATAAARVTRFPARIPRTALTWGAAMARAPCLTRSPAVTLRAVAALTTTAAVSVAAVLAAALTIASILAAALSVAAVLAATASATGSTALALPIPAAVTLLVAIAGPRWSARPRATTAGASSLRAVAGLRAPVSLRGRITPWPAVIAAAFAGTPAIRGSAAVVRSATALGTTST
ncbi:hypothetical protein ACPPVW_08190 [Leifsonia sp. McL0607]|uniref:hypothetical protein n=1 Tax=Leifsonia sp. McL0607 TaxID=3415672 RepID=UPI003CE82FA6